MKNIHIVLFVLAIAILSACDQEFLEHEPTDSASQDQVDDLVKKDPEAVLGIAQANLAGIYTDMFKYRDSHDDFGVKAGELASDLMTDDMTYHVTQWFMYDYRLDNRVSTYRRPRNLWAVYYEMIRGANSIISLLKPSDDNIDLSNEHRNILGQAYAARGYAYFGLINRFQQPYYVDKNAPGVPIYTEEEDLLARQPVKDVYNLIINDLEHALDYLDGLGKSKNEELNEFATAAIMANVLAFVDDYPDQWNEVVKYCDMAIEGGTLFNQAGLLSGFNTVDLSEVLWGSRIDALTTTFYASFFSHIDPQEAGYAGMLGQIKQPATELVNGTSETDYRYVWYDSEDVDGVETYMSYKFRDVGGFEGDYIYYRVAEMYFLKAEALLEAGNTNEAQNTLIEIMNTRDPEYTISAAERSLREEIFFQKRVEMWGEGKRYLDMVRRGEDLNRNNSNNHAPGVIMELPARDRRWIYQIPQVEIDANKEISASDQNP